MTRPGFQAAFLMLWLALVYLSAWVHASVVGGGMSSLMVAATEHDGARLGYAIAWLLALNALVLRWNRGRA